MASDDHLDWRLILGTDLRFVRSGNARIDVAQRFYDMQVRMVRRVIIFVHRYPAEFFVSFAQPGGIQRRLAMPGRRNDQCRLPFLGLN
jgi:hypothetical protein